jgi:hypothetical protein
MKGVIRAGVVPASEQRNSHRDRHNRRTHVALAVALVASLIMSVRPATCRPMCVAALITIPERVAGDADSVFNWTEVPADQEVTITRATFDEGGYQLYDTVGETVVVPFTNHDLYVMKFARSDNGSMYFVNTGSAPVLYVPDGGYLVNATNPTARWFPFSPRFHPATPVYIGIAPSWNDYVNMGWYPDMVYYGGYWCDRPIYDDGIFVAIPGLSIFIGDVDCGGWWPYFRYCDYHRPPFRMAFWNRDVYRWAGRPAFGRPAFGRRAFSQPFGRPAAWAHRTFSGRTIAARPFREFRGAPGGNRNAAWFAGARNFGGRKFGANRAAGRSAAHLGRAANADGRHSFARRGFRSANHFGGGRQSFARRSPGGGGLRFGGGGQVWAHRSFGGGQRFIAGGSPHFGGGGPHFGGNGGGHSGFGGGARPAGGGDRRHDH